MSQASGVPDTPVKNRHNIPDVLRGRLENCQSISLNGCWSFSLQSLMEIAKKVSAKATITIYTYIKACNLLS